MTDLGSGQAAEDRNTAHVFKTIDRHILSEWLVILLMVTGGTFGLLMLEDMFGGVRKLLQFGASFGQISFYYAILAPSLLKMVLPISILTPPSSIRSEPARSPQHRPLQSTSMSRTTPACSWSTRCWCTTH